MITLALRRVRILSKVREKRKEFFGLAKEQVAPSQRIQSSHSRAFGLRRPNDRTLWKIPVKKNGRLRHDQICLELFPAEARIVVQVVKNDLRTGHWIDIGQRWCIPRLVVPGLEVGDLRATDAEHDSQHFDVLHALRQGRIEARPALLDRAEVKSRHVGNRLCAIGNTARFSAVRDQVVVRPRNSGAIINVHGLRERISEIGILRAAAVTRPLTRVHIQVHQVCQSANLFRAIRLARRQRGKPSKVDGFRSP